MKIFKKIKRFFIENFKIIYPHERKFIRKFISEINPSNALIVEANDFHNETLPSYADYFNKIGCKCDILITPKALKNNVFFNIDNSFYNKISCARHNVIYKILSLKEIKKYKYILVASDEITLLRKKFSNLENLQDKNVVLVEHDLNTINKEIKEKYKFCCLCEHKNPNYTNNVVNPHYFGKVNITAKNDTTSFIAVGRVQQGRMDYGQIYKSLKEINKKDTKDFNIVFAGVEVDKIDPKIASANYFKYIYSPNFKELYNEVEKSDFILMPFNLSQHKKYLTHVTTGQMQLSLGFLKPIIINEEFADVYSLNDNNAIIYKGANLDEAIIRAINMPKEDYEQMQRNIKKLKDKIFEKSCTNFYNLFTK